MERANVFYRVFNFYREGFRNMTVGRTLWALILIKLFIMFAILRVFFFPRQITGSTQERTMHVIENLTNVTPDL